MVGFEPKLWATTMGGSAQRPARRSRSSACSTMVCAGRQVERAAVAAPVVDDDVAVLQMGEHPAKGGRTVRCAVHQDDRRFGDRTALHHVEVAALPGLIVALAALAGSLTGTVPGDIRVTLPARSTTPAAARLTRVGGLRLGQQRVDVAGEDDPGRRRGPGRGFITRQVGRRGSP